MSAVHLHAIHLYCAFLTPLPLAYFLVELVFNFVLGAYALTVFCVPFPFFGSGTLPIYTYPFIAFPAKGFSLYFQPLRIDAGSIRGIIFFNDSITLPFSDNRMLREYMFHRCIHLDNLHIHISYRSFYFTYRSIAFDS